MNYKSLENITQYQTTKKLLSNFMQAFDDLNDTDAQANVHPLLLQAQKDGIMSMIQIFQQEVDEWERRLDYAIKLGVDLFKIITHGEICTADEIVYREKDIIELLKSYGFPEPDFQRAVEQIEDQLKTQPE